MQPPFTSDGDGTAAPGGASAPVGSDAFGDLPSVRDEQMRSEQTTDDHTPEAD